MPGKNSTEVERDSDRRLKFALDRERHRTLRGAERHRTLRMLIKAMAGAVVAGVGIWAKAKNGL